MVRPADNSLRLALLLGSGPKYDYLLRRISEHFRVVALIRETGTQPRLRTRAGRGRAYQRVWRRWTMRDCYRRRFFGTMAPAGTAAVTTRSVNEPSVRAALEAVNFDLTVVCGTSLIKEPVLGSLGCAVNLHAGYLPWYKGNHTVFFAYRDRAWDRLGSTIHLLGAALDSGPVIATVRPQMFPRDNDERLYCRAAESGIDLLIEVLRRLEVGDEPVWATPQAAVGAMFRHRDRRLAQDLRVAVSRLVPAGRPPRAGQVIHWATRTAEAIDVRSLLAGKPPQPSAGSS